jgi:hypothetical protein
VSGMWGGGIRIGTAELQVMGWVNTKTCFHVTHTNGGRLGGRDATNAINADKKSLCGSVVTNAKLLKSLCALIVTILALVACWKCL